MSLPRFRWISTASSGVKRAAAPVVDVPEGDPVSSTPGERVAKREHLEPARVGEDRPVPAHEPVQPAELAISSSPGRKCRW